jgi:hypothetical protein
LSDAGDESVSHLFVERADAGVAAKQRPEQIDDECGRGPGIGPLDKEMGDRLIAGVGQGLVYGAVVEPRVPGPSLVKGALYGTAEYAVDPVGGLSRLLGAHAPQHRLPVIGHLLKDLDPHDRAYLEHVVFGVALALLYGSSPSSNGIRIDLEGE